MELGLENALTEKLEKRASSGKFGKKFARFEPNWAINISFISDLKFDDSILVYWEFFCICHLVTVKIHRVAILYSRKWHVMKQTINLSTKNTGGRQNGIINTVKIQEKRVNQVHHFSNLCYIRNKGFQKIYNELCHLRWPIPTALMQLTPVVFPFRVGNVLTNCYRHF